MVEVTRVLPGMGLLTLVAVVMHGNVVEQVEVPSVAIADDDFVPCASGHFIIQSGTTVDAKLPCWDVVTGMSATIRNGDLLVAVNGMNLNTCRVPFALMPTGLAATVHSLAADRSVYW